MVVDAVYNTLITKSFYFMLNMVLALFQPQEGAVDHLWPCKGEERSGKRCFLGYLSDILLGKNHNVVEDIVYNTLIKILC